MQHRSADRKKIAVVGTGISGMAAAWLLSQRHDVTVYERAERLGGHSNTVMASIKTGTIPVDTGFIVYNEATYPNLTALFTHLGVATKASDMSLAISAGDGALEYSGGSLAELFAQKRNLVSRRFWSMLGDLFRFYRQAPHDLADLDERTTLGAYLDAKRYGSAFRDDHLLPMAGAIWSTPAEAMLDYPAASFIRFQDNHGLLKFSKRPAWRTVVGGSRAYVERLTASFADRVHLNAGVTGVRRDGKGIDLCDMSGRVSRFDHIVIATHADQALRLLDDPTPPERTLLSSIRYTKNLAVLHCDDTLMPKHRKVWSSWNYIAGRGAGGHGGATVTYWMNRLQQIPRDTPFFVTLNPPKPPRNGTLFASEIYEHPLFDSAAIAAQRCLWSLQGLGNTWFCGAYFGAGFHEDGLQAGLAVAEAIGGVRRPWTVANESGRIFLRTPPSASSISEFAA